MFVRIVCVVMLSERSMLCGHFKRSYWITYCKRICSRASIQSMTGGMDVACVGLICDLSGGHFSKLYLSNWKLLFEGNKLAFEKTHKNQHWRILRNSENIEDDDINEMEENVKSKCVVRGQRGKQSKESSINRPKCIYIRVEEKFTNERKNEQHVSQLRLLRCGPSNFHRCFLFARPKENVFPCHAMRFRLIFAWPFSFHFSQNNKTFSVWWCDERFTCPLFMICHLHSSVQRWS